MEAFIAAKRSEIEKLCRRFDVTRLELFGSGQNGSFDPDSSDLDFLVEFAPLAPAPYASAFLGLQQALEELFGRPVDLIVASAVRNPYFRQSIEQSKALLYAA